MSVNKTQIGGDHYKGLAIQVWDFAEANNLSYIEGMAIKYIVRRKANREEDLNKAIHCLQKLLELENSKPFDHQNPYANVPEEE